MAFAWEKPIKVEKRVQDAAGQRSIQRLEVPPKEIVSDPFNYRMEDIIHALCLSTAELIVTAEAQAKSAEQARRIREMLAAAPEKRGG